jgi:hypothetical protein
MNKPSLEREQIQLLAELVRAYRNTPREKRQPFRSHRSFTGANSPSALLHPGMPSGSKIYESDISDFERAGLITVQRRQPSAAEFEITEKGFEYAQQLVEERGTGVERIEQAMRDYFDVAGFAKRYPKAFAKWSSAEVKLHTPDASEEATVIGHLCREAMQDFATELVGRIKPADCSPDPTKTVKRVGAALLAVPDLSDTLRKFLDALLEYWNQVNELVQRQEHAGLREGQSIRNEDSRRLVFQLWNVMYEIDRTSSGI